MRAVVVYESMYGNTHLIADEIGNALRGAADVVVVPVDQATDEVLSGADLLVVGGPTHVHGMSRTNTRKAALDAARKPESGVVVDADAEGPGLRDWFETLGPVAASAAAFDTRIDAPPALTGRASKGIARRLRQHGCTVMTDPESFLVTKANHLEDTEGARAREWGTRLASILGDRADAVGRSRAAGREAPDRG